MSVIIHSLFLVKLHSYIKIGKSTVVPVPGPTIVDGGPVIMAKMFGVFGTKTCSFIKENRTKNGPLVFCTVLCSKHGEKLGN